MSVSSSQFCIEGEQGRADWYQNPLNLTTDSLCQKESELGQGAFSIVDKVNYRGQVWALKRPLTQPGSHSILREARLLIPLNQKEKSVNQEHFVQVIAYITLSSSCMVLLPLYQGGNLFSRIEKSEKGLSLESTLKITEQILKALSFLKEQEIIHRDIKPENILMVGSDDTIRLGDFGLAMKKVEEEQRKEIFGTIEYLSPELLETLLRNLDSFPYDFPSDMWATGCTLFFVFRRMYLFELKQGPGMVANLESQQKDAVRCFDAQMVKVASDKKLHPSSELTFFQATLKGMLHLEPKERLTPEYGIASFYENVSRVSTSALEEVS